MAIVSADQFGPLVKKWAEKKKLDIDKVARAFVIQISASIILKTPVGNPDLWKSPAPSGYVGGRARNNWFPSISAISSETTKNKAKSGKASINKTKAASKALEAGDTFYLTNNLPYIRRLEYEGWSTQAAAGMVRESILEAEQALISAINSIK
tara:strand:+ start:530 stop:988 length:459 start_codon:yes stop_codon:yes gene_type:complete